jgi:hypothetical protein
MGGLVEQSQMDIICSKTLRSSILRQSFGPNINNRYAVYLCMKTIDLAFVQNPKEHEICSKRKHGTLVPLVKY